MSPNARYRSLLPLLTGFLLLASMAFGTLWLVGRQADAFRLVAHTQEVQQRLTSIQTALLNAETGQRGFLLTGREEYLQPYHEALAGLGSEFAGLRAAIVDNPGQERRLAVLRSLANRRQDVLRATLEQFRQGGAAGAIMLVR